jgi:hypothetical protein
MAGTIDECCEAINLHDRKDGLECMMSALNEGHLILVEGVADGRKLAVSKTWSDLIATLNDAFFKECANLQTKLEKLGVADGPERSNSNNFWCVHP